MLSNSFINQAIASSEASQVSLTIEEQRVANAQQAMSVINDYFDWSSFKKDWLTIDDFNSAQQSLSLLGEQLWQHSKIQVQSGKTVDDRPLYWTRLAIISFVKTSKIHFNTAELSALLEVFENSSRGRSDLAYRQKTDKRILLTGFDPFY